MALVGRGGPPGPQASCRQASDRLLCVAFWRSPSSCVPLKNAMETLGLILLLV